MVTIATIYQMLIGTLCSRFHGYYFTWGSWRTRNVEQLPPAYYWQEVGRSCWPHAATYWYNLVWQGNLYQLSYQKRIVSTYTKTHTCVKVYIYFYPNNALRLQSNITSVNHVQHGFDEDAQQYFDGVHFPLSLGIWSSTMGTNIKEKQYLSWTQGGRAAQKGPCLGEDKMGAGSYADVVVGCAKRCVGKRPNENVIY